MLSALRGTSAARPLTVANLLAAVDAREHVILTREELNGALARLIGDGKAHELESGRYAAGRGSGAFTPVDEASFERAVAEHTGEPGSPESEDDDGDSVRLLVRFHCGDARPSDTELDELSDTLEDAVGDRADLLGFELGPGVVELHLAVDEDESSDEIVRALVPASAEATWARRFEIAQRQAGGAERRLHPAK